MGTASFQSFAEMYLHRVSSTPDLIAFKYPVQEGDQEVWKEMSWKESLERVQGIAGGMLDLGLEREQRAALLSSTRVEWLLVDLGVLCASGATTTIYPSNTAEECAYIINDSDTRVVFVEDDGQLAKIASIRDQIPQVHHVVNMTGKGGHDGWAITLAELEALGGGWNDKNPGKFEEIARAVTSDQLATLIYTSGTTGRSKGVELTHDAWVFEGEAIDNLGIITPADTQYLFLPLAHSFGKVMEAAMILIGVPTAVDGRIDKLVSNLAVVQPTWMSAVPRIFEKVYNKIISGAREGGALKLKIFTWSVGVGSQVSQLRQKGQEPTGMLALKYRIADKLVFSKLRAIFGGRMRFFISGSAPLNRQIAEFFHAADVLIIEGYGLTETSAASCVNVPGKNKFGTVGPPLPGVKVKIDEADGEILLGGRGLMRGYHNLPEVTAETLTEDGWLRTGDIGQIDADGFVKITDRKKDLIKTSGGKYVAPQALEGRLKVLNTMISQVLVHGNRRNYCSALITLDPDALQKWADENGKSGLSYKELTQLPEVTALIEPAVAELNDGLARYETIKKFAILPQDFTIETGELTPSMKVKRKLVEERYKDVLDGFYTDALASLG